MPQGKGTYGSTRGRPPKKDKKKPASMKGAKVKMMVKKKMR